MVVKSENEKVERLLKLSKRHMYLQEKVTGLRRWISEARHASGASTRTYMVYENDLRCHDETKTIKIEIDADTTVKAAEIRIEELEHEIAQIEVKMLTPYYEV